MTLIEILVVLLILAVLASIGLAVFVNQRAKWQDTDAKAAATLVAKTLLAHQQDQDTYATADRDALEPAIAGARGLEVTGDEDGFEISVTSPSGTAGGGPFRIEHDSGRTTRRCDYAGEGGCPDGGLW